jgi:uncharacterized SAM-binding protein YcdF (DUF218 family)
MLSQIANIISSPLVHAPIIYLICRLAQHYSAKKLVFRLASYLPIVWLFLCSMTYPSVLLIKPLEDQYPVIKIESNKWRETNAIVILACNYFEDDDLPFISRWPNCSLQRNMQAVLMYQTHKMPIYLAGDVLGLKDTQSQAIHNRDFLEKFGVAPSDIHTIAKGKNTETEVAALVSILNTNHITLVTSASHLPRAVRYFENKNIRVVPVPVEHLSRRKIEMSLGLPNSSSLYRSERAIHEYLGLVYQRLFL